MRDALSRREAIMWRKEYEYSLAALVDHPVLGLVMISVGIDRRAVELLLEAVQPIRQPEPDRRGDPICV
jgi:hypothetical protein